VVCKVYEELLENTGLTKNEAKVYLSLLRLGKAKSGQIIKDANISSGKIYEILTKLSDKGLIKVVIENGIKNFIANKPETLLDYLNEKEKILHEKKDALQKILPKLEGVAITQEHLENVSLIKGLRGLSPIVYDALERGKDIRVMGVRSSKNVVFNNFWKNWHRKRIELKKKALMLFSDKNTDYWRFFKKMPHTEVREILSFSPSAVMLIDDNCFLLTYEEDLICIHVQSKAIANSFRSFFEGLWSYAGK
jgi:sugar-specific transcriptional regulator TrmB